MFAKMSPKNFSKEDFCLKKILQKMKTRVKIYISPRMISNIKQIDRETIMFSRINTNLGENLGAEHLK